MDFWVKDSNHRKGEDLGATGDDWGYWGSHLKDYSGLDSEAFKQKFSHRYTKPDFRIKTSLYPDDWQYLMKILAKMDVSHITHMELVLPTYPLASGLGEMFGMDHLGTVLGTGRFSALVSLRIRSGKLNSEGLGQVDSASLAAALRTGQFTNLEVLSLPACDAAAILGALNDGSISQLMSFSIRNRKPGIDKKSQSNLFKKLDAVLKGGLFKNMQHLDLSNGVLDGLDGWETFIGGVNSGMVPNITSLRLSQNALVNLADLVPLLLLNPLQNLIIDACWITSDQVCGMANTIANSGLTILALKRLDLHDNMLENRAVGALVDLADSDQLPHLRYLDLSSNKGTDSRALVSLTETIERGHLPSLENLKWERNLVSDTAAEAIAEAFMKNEALLTSFGIDWNYVSDRSLRTKVNEYRTRNMRLCALKEKHEELKDVVQLTFAKIFLCGYAGVGKTTLRKTLNRSLGLRTRLIWETRPVQEPRTRGIEISRLVEEESNRMTLILWDLAGQEEYHVLHGSFLADLGFAGGKATAFVLVFRSSFEKDVEAKLLYWLRFTASSSLKHVKRHVVIVLNCFDGKRCTADDKRLWMALIEKFKDMFNDLLDIFLDPFTIDVRVAASAKPLKDHLFNHARLLLKDVEVPRVCLELLEELKGRPYRERNNLLPILSWQAFEKHVNLERRGNQFSRKNLQAAASFLHEIGGIIYFAEKKLAKSRSENKSLVVPDPQWFCKQVVGQLLLPKGMLEGGSSLLLSADGSISTILFQSYFKHLLVEGTQSDDVISMLERMGLCFRKGEDKIIVPALIHLDDYRSIEWERQGFHAVMGRCLATEDQERSAIPVTLFRQLQVDLAQDLNFGGRGDSEYKAGKTFSSFKVGELLVLIQFDVDHADPTDDRIDILVKNMIPGDSTSLSLVQVKCICEIMQKLEVLCFACCPGLKYDIKVIKPWGAREKTPKMTERKCMSLREIKVLMMRGRQYTSWLLSGYQLELKTFLSDSELREVLEIKGVTDEVTDDLDVSLEPVEVIKDPDFWAEVMLEVLEDPDVSLEVAEVAKDLCVSLNTTEMLQDSEVSLEETVERDYDECKRNAVTLGLLTEVSLQTLEESEEEDGRRAPSLHMEGSHVGCQGNGYQGVTNRVFYGAVHKQNVLIEELKQIVLKEGHLTREHNDKQRRGLSMEIQLKHDLLVRHIQEQQAFSIEEKERSVPRYMFLSQKQGKFSKWIRLREAFQKTFILHLLCEAHFDNGFLHEVEDQEGIELTKPKEWLVKVSPWLRRSLQVAIMVGKTVGNVYLPGVFNLIPDCNFAIDGEALAKAVDSAATTLLEQDEGANQVQDGRGNYGTTTQPVNLKERSIAQEVVKDLINEVGHVEFAKKIGLRKVLLRAKVQPHVGSSKQAQPSVFWICDACYKKYGDRATDISPKR